MHILSHNTQWIQQHSHYVSKQSAIPPHVDTNGELHGDGGATTSWSSGSLFLWTCKSPKHHHLHTYFSHTVVPCPVGTLKSEATIETWTIFCSAQSSQELVCYIHQPYELNKITTGVLRLSISTSVCPRNKFMLKHCAVSKTSTSSSLKYQID